MRRLSVLILFLLTMVISSSVVTAQDNSTDDPTAPLSPVLVYNVWAEPGPAAGETRAYLTIENAGAATAR